MKKNIKLETRLFYTDVTEQFEVLKDDSMDAVDFTLQEFKDIIDNLIAVHGKDALIGAALEGDEYSAEWSWLVTIEREETLDEYHLRIKREKEQLDREKKRIKEREQQEKRNIYD